MWSWNARQWQIAVSQKSDNLYYTTWEVWKLKNNFVHCPMCVFHMMEYIILLQESDYF
jgi:hypothetical protein